MRSQPWRRLGWASRCEFLTDGDDFADDVARQHLPSVGFWQLWRGCQNRVQAIAHIGDHSCDQVGSGVRQGDLQARLSGMCSQTGAPREQQGA